MADEFEPVTIKQNRGPALHFQGKLLASTSWDSRSNRMTLELWQTAAGALIPVTRSENFGDKRDLISAAVIAPIYKTGDIDAESSPVYVAVKGPIDEQAMRFAVMDFWDWTDGARSMVRKLGWSLKRIVE